MSDPCDFCQQVRHAVLGGIESMKRFFAWEQEQQAADKPRENDNRKDSDTSDG